MASLKDKKGKSDDVPLGNSPSGLLSSLSDYFLPETVYFYSFPSGDSSGFFNQVPPWKEELVSARPLIYAGEKVKVITYASAVEGDAWDLVTNHLSMPVIDRSRIVVLPKEITSDIFGNKRNELVKLALKTLLPEKSLMMAQPLLDEEIRSKYQIDPALIVKLNDKINRGLYTNKKYLPKEYKTFKTGKEFSESTDVYPFPCVAKVSSSSAGDGVRICKNKEDIERAKKDFTNIKGDIIVEEFIHSIKNLGIQFAVSPNKNKEIEILGYSKQLTTEEGEYLGGVVNMDDNMKFLNKIYSVLLEEMLPLIRSWGWYGIGGIDVLIDKDEEIFFIDPNFRMTAASSYILLNKNKKLPHPIVSFSGLFRGTKEDFIKKIVPIAKEGTGDQILKIIAITKTKDFYGLNAGLFFDDYANLREHVKKLLSLGIEANVLNKINSSNDMHLG